jgi:hypothetical protein
MIAQAALFVDKATAAETRDTLERAERDMGEAYKKSEAEEHETAARNLADATRRLTRVTVQLAAMSPAKRAMPAWIQIVLSGANAGSFAFADPGTPGFDHLIADKPECYRLKGSRVAVRSQLIYFRIQEYQGEEQADRSTPSRLSTGRPRRGC